MLPDYPYNVVLKPNSAMEWLGFPEALYLQISSSGDCDPYKPHLTV